MRTYYLAALALAFIFPTTADAFQATTTKSVNVRSGAGTKFSRVLTLPAGAPVWVDFCSGSWCSVSGNGVTGWVSSRYLSSRGDASTYPRPTINTPTVPPNVPPLVVPRKDYHYYGYSRQHQFQRPFD